MSEWTLVKIGDIAEKIAMGPFGSNIKVETFVDSGVPVISGPHLRESRLRDLEYNFVTDDHAERMKNSIVFRGDVIFTHAGNISNLAYIPDSSKYDRYVISQRQFYLRCNLNRADPHFITYFFHSPAGRYKLLANSSQTGVPSIAQPSSYLKSISILLPPLHEQKAIAHILGSLDDKIDQLRKTNSVLEEMASALFKSWFVDFDPVKAKQENRPTGLPPELDALFPDSFEDSSLGPIPRGWRVAKAGDEVTVVGGTTPSTANSAYWLNGTHYWATPKDLSEQKLPILSGTSRSVTDEGLATISSRLLEPGTVLLSSRAPVGYLAITEVPVAINQGFIAIKSSSNTPTGFVYEWCKNNIDEFLKHSSGTTFLELSKSAFKRISILMPVSSIISEYEDHHKDLFKRVSSNIHQIRTLTNLRDTLLPKLISGELRVPEAEQMVAELGL